MTARELLDEIEEFQNNSRKEFAFSPMRVCVLGKRYIASLLPLARLALDVACDLCLVRGETPDCPSLSCVIRRALEKAAGEMR